MGLKTFMASMMHTVVSLPTWSPDLDERRSVGAGSRVKRADDRAFDHDQVLVAGWRCGRGRCSAGSRRPVPPRSRWRTSTGTAGQLGLLSQTNSHRPLTQIDLAKVMLVHQHDQLAKLFQVEYVAGVGRRVGHAMSP